MVRAGDTPPFTMHPSVSSLDFISTFVACGVGDVYIAICFGIAIFTRKSIVFQTTRLTLAFAMLLSCTIVFLKSPPEAHLRRYVCINSLRVSGALCICIKPVILSYDLCNNVKSYRAKTVIWVSLLSTLALLGVGGWQYITTDSQWLWLFIMIPSAMPTLVTVALGSKLGEKRIQTLQRIIVTEGWVALPVLFAIVLAAAACIIPNKRAPGLHGIQFLIHYLLGLSPTVGRETRRVLLLIQPRPSESSENLFSSERTVQELQNLESQHSTLETD